MHKLTTKIFIVTVLGTFFKANLISTWNENMANKNPFFRPSKVNDSWKKQVFGETHYWNLEWIKEEITLSNG